MKLNLDEEHMEAIVASRLMMLRRGNPDMGGPSMQDKRWAKEIVEDLLWNSQQVESPQDVVVRAGQEVLEALRARRDKLIAEGRCPHSVYSYESISQIPYCKDCGADLTDELKTWID